MPSRPNGPRTRAEERADEIDISPTTLLATIDALQAEADAAKAQADEYLVALQRERAEFVNFKRRTQEERLRDLGLAAEDLLRKVLTVADDFDLAIEKRPEDLLRKVLTVADDFDLAIEKRPEAIASDPWFEGVSAIDRKLRVLLESEGVTAVAAAPGATFDPREHEAIANVPGTGRSEGEIVELVRRGYKLRDRVLRPALVAVAAGADGPLGDGVPSGDAPTSEPITRPN